MIHVTKHEFADVCSLANLRRITEHWDDDSVVDIEDYSIIVSYLATERRGPYPVGLPQGIHES